MNPEPRWHPPAPPGPEGRDHPGSQAAAPGPDSDTDPDNDSDADDPATYEELDPNRSRRADQRGRRPAGLAWWQTPRDPRARGPHGRADAADGPAARGPAALLRSRFGSRSQHRRPLTTEQQRQRRRRRIKWSIIGGIATVVLGPVFAFLLGYAIFSVPTPDEAVNNQVAVVSYDDGSPLARLVPEQGNRTKVPIEKIPLHVREAVLAAEDRTFYSNPGFDLTGILRAGWNQLRGGSGGGSTISQQYVKKTLVGDEATLFRKWKEMIVSVKVNQERSKDEILTDYLNTIYFGRGAYGVQSASQAYFGKNVDQLTPSEGALLAGLIQSPSRWDPALNADKAVQRWQFVIDGMSSQGWLTAQQRAEAKFPATVARKLVAGGVPVDDRGHIVSAVRDELESLGISDQDFAQGGLRITTTIDPKHQQEAVDAAHAGLAGQPANLRAAVVAIDPATGGVQAYYGGDNGVGLDYAKVRKQAGSTFKPFAVLAGLLQDPPVGLGEVFDGKAVPGLRNSEGADCARCDLKQAMTISNNVVFNTLSKQVGAQKVADAAHAAGITSPLTDPDERIALGNKEVTPLELASAYATLSSGGIYHEPHLVTKVVTADGRVLYDAAPSDGERRFPERVARNVTEAMLDVASADGLSVPGVRQVAAKTGTVQSRFAGQNNDAWMSGFTPDLVATVWIGTDMNSPIRTSDGTPISGSTVPGEVWKDFMADAARSAPPSTFAPYHAIGDPPSNRPPGEDPRAPAPPSSTVPSTPPTSTPPSGVPVDPAAPGTDPRAVGGAPVTGAGAPTSGPAVPTTRRTAPCTLLDPCG